MVPEEWPIDAPRLDQGATPARHAGRRRLATVRRDFFLDPVDRLTEQERAVMSAMLADLLGGVATEIRAALPSGSSAANDEDGQQLVRQLGKAGLLDQPELISVLLRRADEERIANALRARSSARPAFLQALISDSSEEVSSAAMAVILARGRRHDRLGQPRIDFDDLSPQLARSLGHSVAAALRLARRSAQGSKADGDIGTAVAALIERHDPARSGPAVTAKLAEALIATEKLDEDLLAASAEEGDVGFLSEALAAKAGIGGTAAWDHLLDGTGGGFVALLRMAEVSRSLAARLLASLADLIGIADPGAQIAEFDAMEDGAAEKSRHWLRLDPDYRSALTALGEGRG